MDCYVHVPGTWIGGCGERVFERRNVTANAVHFAALEKPTAIVAEVGPRVALVRRPGLRGPERRNASERWPWFLVFDK